MFTLQLIPKCDYFTSDFWYQTLEIYLEIMRRFMWTLLRLDNQQATNCENYVAGNFVPILIDHVMEENNQGTMDLQAIRQSIERS